MRASPPPPPFLALETCSDSAQRFRICLNQRAGWSCSLWLGQGATPRRAGGTSWGSSGVYRTSKRAEWLKVLDVHTWREELRYQCRTLVFTTSGDWRNLGNFSRTFNPEAHLLKALLSLVAITLSLSLWLLRLITAKLMKILCTASKLGTALFLVHLHSSHPPSSSPCPTSSGSNVSQDCASRIKPHNELF